MTTDFLCPVCNSYATATDRRIFRGGRRYKRHCYNGHRFTTYRPAGKPETLAQRLPDAPFPAEKLPQLGENGCNCSCPAWRGCKEMERERGLLPCEVALEDEAEWVGVGERIR